LFLWFLGGIIALIGAMAYAELGTLMPRSGGEYHFLSRIYHPALGFVSGWISFIVGFAAPTAAATMALSAYFTAALDITGSWGGFEPDTLIAVGVVASLTWLHARHKRTGAGFQNVVTSMKVILLLGFILLGVAGPDRSGIAFELSRDSLREVISPPFAIALFFVSFAYSGWNASAYIAGEIRNPARNIPGSLIPGTLLVTFLYMGITWAFLRVIPLEVLSGKIEIGYLFGYQILGAGTGRVLGLVFTFLLLSTVSSLIITGPRVTQVMGQDYPAISWFAETSRQDTPARAIYIQAGLACIYILSSTFEQMITYIGFTLNLMTLLSVAGLILLRRRGKGGSAGTYRIKPYPLLPLFFILVNGWIMVYGMIYRPLESIGGVLTAGLGLIVWMMLHRNKARGAG
jgi:APA family basic amino acid/polyamine antiporter